METTFKISRHKEYINIEYIAGIKIPFTMFTNVFVSSAKEGRNLVSYVRNLEDEIKKNLELMGYDLDYRLIIAKYIQVIDSIACGLDIRSKMKVQEVAERFVRGFKEKYDEAVKEAEETLAYFNEVKDTKTYIMDWKRYDKYNELVNNFMLKMPKISSDDFKNDELTNMLESTKDILTLIKELKTERNEK